MTEENKNLIVLPDLTAVELYTAEKMDVLLEEIRKKVESTVLPDTSTDANRKEIIAFSYEITQTKTMIQKAGLKITEKWRTDTKTVNQAKKTADEFLTLLAKDTRKSVTEWEAEEEIRKAEELRIEQERIESIRKKITGMGDKVVSAVGKSSIEIQEIIYSIEDVQVNEEAFSEFKDTAWEVKENTVKKLRDLRDASKLQEEEATRLAKQKEEMAKEEEERKAKVEAEDKRLRESVAEIAESNKKLEEEKRRVAADRKEVDTHYEELTTASARVQEYPKTPDECVKAPSEEIVPVVDVKQEAIMVLAGAVGEELAEMVIDMIIVGEVPGVTFNGTEAA